MAPPNPPTTGYLADATQTTPTPAPDALRQKVATLHVRYENGRGEVLEGTLQNRILKVGQRIKVDLDRSQRCGGVPPESMSARAYSLLYAICWLKESIVSAPDWAQNLAETEEEGLVEEIWRQVSDHEARFHGRGDAQGAG